MNNFSTLISVPEQRIVIETPELVQPVARDISLECPVDQSSDVHTITWYRVRDDGQTVLLASYDEETGETTVRHRMIDSRCWFIYSIYIVNCLYPLIHLACHCFE